MNKDTLDKLVKLREFVISHHKQLDGKTNPGPNGHVHKIVNGEITIDCSDGCHNH